MNKDSRIIKILIALMLLISITSPFKVYADDNENADEEYVETGNSQPGDKETDSVSEGSLNAEENVSKEETVIEEDNNTEENSEDEIIFSTGYRGFDFIDTDKFIIHRRNLRKSGGNDDEGLPSAYTVPLSEIKDQRQYGTCWTFATMASAESTYFDRTGRNLDLSELHLAFYCYHNLGYPDSLDLVTDDGLAIPAEDKSLFQSGGNYFISASMLSSGIGFAYEDDLPYKLLDNKNYTLERFEEEIMTEGEAENCYGATDYYLVNADLYSPYDLQSIKEALYHNGAVAMSYYAIGSIGSNQYYNADEVAYYCYEKQFANHAVTIVGYDDNFSREFFVGNKSLDDPDVKLPENDGAFLVKNSWGTTYGKNGYFWLSYEDVSFLNSGNAVQFFLEGTDDLHIYQYDGTVPFYVITADYSVDKLANIFTAQNDEQIRRVGYWTAMSNVLSTISIYRNVSDSPENGTPIKSYTVNNKFAGYHTYDLEEAVDIGKDEKFAIVIMQESLDGEKMVNYVSGTDIGGEYNFNAYDDVSEGQSFFWEDGQWHDLCGYDGDYLTAPVKAFCQNTPEEDMHYEYQGGSLVPEFDPDVSSPLSFCFKRKVLDDLSFKRFKCAYVDEKLLNGSDYFIKPGSLNITLNQSYLEKLSVGTHSLKVEFTDGLSAAADFKVLRKSEPPKPASYQIPLTGIE